MKIRTQPRVAVLLAAYNGTKFIEAQLDSILGQIEVDISIFISVDLSSDATHDLCLKFERIHPNVVVLPYGGQFGGAARNFFRLIRDVSFEDYDYVSFADQDDIWLPDKLARAVEKLQSTHSDAYSSNVLAFWPSGKRRLVLKSQPQRQWDYLFEAAGPGCTYVISHKLALAIQRTVNADWSGINNIGLHDWFMYAYARAHGFTWFIDERPGMLYRQHLDNQVGVNKGLKAFLHRFRKVMGGWGIEQSVLTANAVGLGETRFVAIWNKHSRFGLVWLAFRANSCRRKPQDRVLFFCACLLMAAVGKRP
jgi:rhamnosyltransferase